MKFYSCRFAPSAETWRHACRGQAVIHRGQRVLESFAPHAFAGSRASEVPVLIDHDVTKRAGTVTVFASHGGWHLADFVLDGPYASRAAEFIERSGKVSPGFTELDKDPICARDAIHWYTRATLDEISILPPDAIAWYEGAKVTGASEPPAAVPSSDCAVAGEVIHEPVGTVIRRNIGTVLAVGGVPVRPSLPHLSWPVGEVVEHVGQGVVRTASGRIIRS